ncbi:MLO-like protein 1 [Impatiens glandulifera]|uniref:MLO-like protein 1 n=1 Tax=Impatiens glandulifera TaxID=253017 RepID=UPI001FB0C136|nr:MLO-like protein 1 [Impatiens glandulifera]
MSSDEAEEGNNLEYTPTWAVAAVCTVIVGISFSAERLLHFAGNRLKKKKQMALYEALEKIKEELMLLGFISVLLTVFQGSITKICVGQNLMHHFLPCKLPTLDDYDDDDQFSSSSSLDDRFRHFLAKLKVSGTGYCASKVSSLTCCLLQNKVPLLSVESIHHLHVFIFVIAVVHVSCCVLTIIFGGAKVCAASIQQWKHWEDSVSIANNNQDHPQEEPTLTHVREHEFIKSRFLNDKCSVVLGWMHSLTKQFYGSVTKSDYLTLRRGFIMTHCRGNPKFNFHRYMLRALEDDFVQVVGISWYLWIFVVIFLLLNVNGWHTYFWLAFIPFILLLAVGFKLEHVMTQLAREVADKHVAVEGELVVQPSDDHFWFNSPHIIVYLIHFILFQNAFEIAFFFWILVQFGFDSCIMGHVRYMVPRISLGVIIQVLCSYSTLPLYAIVTQMGSSFKKAIFEKHVQVGLVGWARDVKKRQQQQMKEVVVAEQVTTNDPSTADDDVIIEMADVQTMKEEFIKKIKRRVE